MTPTLTRLCFLLIPLALNAQAQVDEAQFCRNGLFPREQENLRLGVVQGSKNEKVHFFNDQDGCPSNGLKCMGSAYLVPGDQVLVGKSTADWACVWYQGRKREFVSWVPKRNLSILPTPPLHPVRDWVGVWSDGYATIRIFTSGTKNTLRMSSKLRWYGGVSPDGEPIENYGGTEADLDVQGQHASASDSVCHVVLTRIGRYLVADDNGNCGGMNVRHTSVYVRRPQ